jgi:hypothetical protein
MALSAGSRLGPCEILAPLGAGGMGACGYAALADMRSRQRRIGVSSRWGCRLRAVGASASLAVARVIWKRAEAGGPSAVEKMLAPSPSQSDRWR